ncbi:helix-turn-helix transcriptional regulator [Halorientalis brevis]|uniref:Helix-turn-helix transcriptional regulator n=1 Tax=Halorientalis brevis TaxID=1126241 RepID=A0ABD6CHF2_9EURY|nr:helix-turn-helix transcriptional regulator [Halorientalis brevis]
MATIQEPTIDAVESFTDLSTFQREILLSIAKLEAANTDAYGLAIKRELENVYEADVNHGRLYPNLDDLVAAELVEKRALDKRTNEYTLTEQAEQFLTEQRDRIAGVLDDYRDADQ